MLTLITSRCGPFLYQPGVIISLSKHAHTSDVERCLPRLARTYVTIQRVRSSNPHHLSAVWWARRMSRRSNSSVFNVRSFDAEQVAWHACLRHLTSSALDEISQSRLSDRGSVCRAKPPNVWKMLMAVERTKSTRWSSTPGLHRNVYIPSRHFTSLEQTASIGSDSPATQKLHNMSKNKQRNINRLWAKTHYIFGVMYGTLRNLFIFVFFL